ncbi:MAG: DUF6491 family protein [Maricaulaceae bacterium]|jgi:hypothetical protein
MKTLFSLGIAAGLAGSLALAGCQSTTTAAEREAQREMEIAARQGEQVDRICFTRNIRGWREFGDDAVLLEAGLNDWYKVDLSGFCQPDQAFDTIAIESRGGVCLNRGDNISTPDAPLGGRCFIDHIYEWDEEAEVASAN